MCGKNIHHNTRVKWKLKRVRECVRVRARVRVCMCVPKIRKSAPKTKETGYPKIRNKMFSTYEEGEAYGKSTTEGEVCGYNLQFSTI